MNREALDRLISNHLRRYPEDREYVDLLLLNPEFAPQDKRYEGWLRHNLHGIESGDELIRRLEVPIGSIKGKRVLDIGAGGGGNTIALARHGCHVSALEI